MMLMDEGAEEKDHQQLFIAQFFRDGDVGAKIGYLLETTVSSTVSSTHIGAFQSCCFNFFLTDVLFFLNEILEGRFKASLFDQI